MNEIRAMVKDGVVINIIVCSAAQAAIMIGRGDADHFERVDGCRMRPQIVTYMMKN